MLHGQELLNHINSQIEKYTDLGNWGLVDNYKAKKSVLENKGFSQFGMVNHIDKTITKEVVWITDKSQNLFNGTVTNSDGQREFNSNINYWTGEQEEAQTIQLNESDFELKVLETIKTENLTIEYIYSDYKKEDAVNYFKITTNTNKTFYASDYGYCLNTKGIKGIKTFKNEFEENIDSQEIMQKYQELFYNIKYHHSM